MLNIISVIVLVLIANAICFQCNKNSRKNSFNLMMSEETYGETLNSIRSAARMGDVDNNLMMSEETYGETLNSIRSAARMGDVDKLQEIVKKWQKNDILNDRTNDMMGLCPLHWAVAAGIRSRKQCVEVLLNAGAEVDAVNSAGNTPLHYACATQKTECASILIDFKANVNAKGLSGQTPLHLVAMKDDIDTLQLLLLRGAIINDVDNNGDTALHFSRRFGNKKSENLLIEHRADINIKNNKGQTPYDYEAAEITNFSYE